MNLLVKIFAPKIFIDVNPNYFVFQLNEKHLELQTYVCIDDHNKILSVGEEPIESFIFNKIELFKNGSNQQVDKFEILEEFMKYAVKRLVSKTAMIRPVIVYRGTESFNQLFQGYENSIFENVAIRVGACAVYRENENA